MKECPHLSEESSKLTLVSVVLVGCCDAGLGSRDLAAWGRGASHVSVSLPETLLCFFELSVSFLELFFDLLGVFEFFFSLSGFVLL